MSASKQKWSSCKNGNDSSKVTKLGLWNDENVCREATFKHSSPTLMNEMNAFSRPSGFLTTNKNYQKTCLFTKKFPCILEFFGGTIQVKCEGQTWVSGCSQ